MSGFSNNKPLVNSNGDYVIQDGPAIDAFARSRVSNPTFSNVALAFDHRFESRVY